jgi:uncharacterized protein with von Willebrand factor type A (vWA) domain
MYPFGSLPNNLIAFAVYLRREHRFRIGSGELHDAARALDVVDLVDELAVRNALRPILSATHAEAATFDRAFAAFFFPGSAVVPPAVREAPDRGREPDDVDDEDDGREAGAVTALEAHEDDAAVPQAVRALASYSPVDVEQGSDAPELTRPDPAWREAARELVRRQQLGLSRRWRPSTRGRRFDLRRTLRASVQTGGEPLSARWLRRPRRTPRFVVLVDGSRSMGPYAVAGLQMAVAVATATPRIEVFIFSTALVRVTTDVRRAAAGETRRLGRLHHAWAGGTSIGTCLQDFLRRFGERSIGRDTIVCIVSDGLDVGAPDVLRRAIRTVHRQSAAVAWLNPLLDTPGYEPTAGAMRAARRYLTTFASVTDASGLARLARVLRVRA